MSGKIIDVSECLNYDKSRAAENPALKVYKDELYCAWAEYKEIKIKKYDGNSWSDVSECLNYDKSKAAYYPTLQVYKDQLYCVWQEYNGSKNEIKMKKYNGNSWRDISESLNYNTNYHAYNPTLQVYKDELYCAWHEDRGRTEIKIKKYDGNSWSDVSECLNYDKSKAAEYPALKVYKDELYCAWHEENSGNSRKQVKIKKYDGNNWSNVSSSLIYNTGGSAYYPTLQVYRDELYCAWYEYYSSNYQIKMKKYDGNIWTNVSNNLNYNKSKAAEHPTLQVYRNELYCAWYEINGSNNQIKIKKYNGDSWSEVSSSLNYDENRTASYPNLQVYRNELYCAWREYNGSNNQIKIKKYNNMTEKYLLKQNDNYYSINREFYDSTKGQYKPIERKKFEVGFNDLNDLLKEVDGFKPIDKFKGKIEILKQYS